MRLRLRTLVLFTGGLLAACATTPPPSGALPRVLLELDDGRAESPISFPTSSHEAMIRFELPSDALRPARVWLRPAGAGTYRIVLYAPNPLEGPGEPITEVNAVVADGVVSSGKDARWIVTELGDVSPRKGLLWLGVRKVDGDPALWSSSRDAGHYFIRNDDPKNRIELLNVRRTPLVRLELVPSGT